MNLDISRSVQAFLKTLPPKQYKQVAARIVDLTANQSPHDARYLSGHPGYMRIDQGEYRIIFVVDAEIVRVPVVGPRNDDKVFHEFERKA